MITPSPEDGSTKKKGLLSEDIMTQVARLANEIVYGHELTGEDISKQVSTFAVLYGVTESFLRVSIDEHVARRLNNCLGMPVGK